MFNFKSAKYQHIYQQREREKREREKRELAS